MVFRENGIDDTLHDILLFNNYKQTIENNEIIYKKSEYDYDEFKLVIGSSTYKCSVPLKNGCQYTTTFQCLNQANDYLFKHFEYFNENV
tara:strand:- start:339 stop:605 length:267 start_codon:yes stop_codon:yes gene_type:complete